MSLFAKTLIRLGGLPRCGFVRFFDVFWTRMGPFSPWLNDEHVQLSEMGFRQFWARRESCVVQKAPIHWALQALYLTHTGLQDWP